MRDQLNKGKHLFTPLKTKRNSFFQGGENKSMKMRKFIATMMTFAMLLSLVAIPAGSADAATTYNALSTPTKGKTPGVEFGVVEVKITGMVKGDDTDAVLSLGNSAIFEKIEIIDEDQYVSTTGAIELTSGFLNGGKDAHVTFKAAKSGDTTLYVRVTADASASVEGEVSLSISSRKGHLPNGSLVIGKIGSFGPGTTNVTVDKVKTIVNGSSVTLRLIEGSNRALANGKTVELELPDGFKFANANAASVVGGASLGAASGDGTDKITFTSTASGVAEKSIVDITFDVIIDDRIARFGDVNLKVSGTNKLNVSNLLIAKYGDYGIKVSTKDEKELVAGTADKEVGKIIIEEVIPGSLVEGRAIYLTFPQGVKVESYNVDDETLTIGDSLLDESSSENDKERTIKLVVNNGSLGGTTPGKITIKDLKVNTAIGFNGPVEVEISGNAGVTGKVKVADVASPIKVSVEKADVKIGVQNQALGKIVIEEQFAGALKRGQRLNIVLEGGSFDNKGKLVYDDAYLDVEIKDPNNKSNTISLEVKKESITPAKIEIVGVTTSLDRILPEGDVLATIGANSSVGKNAVSDTMDMFEDALNRVAKVAIATVVTPAPDNNTGVVGEVKFVIDAKTYKVNGVEKALDVAPFIQDGRTMLPVRFVAEALGVSEDNIIWNAVTKQVTIMKGDRIAQLTIGSDSMLVNGVSVTMDTKAAVKDGRTVLPVRFVAQALGANIAWDEATRTVTVN